MSNKGVLVRVHHADAWGNVFTLEEPLAICRRDKLLVVPKHFESDGASVPRFLWRFVFPPGDQDALRGAIAHDYIYRHHPDGWTRAEADATFRDIMIADGVERYRALLAYYGVRSFGWIAWRQGGAR